MIMFKNPTDRVTGITRRTRDIAETDTFPSSRTCTMPTVRSASTTARTATKATMKSRPACAPYVPVAMVASKMVPIGGIARAFVNTENGPWNPIATTASHSTRRKSGIAASRTGEDTMATNPRSSAAGMAGMAVSTGGRAPSRAPSPRGRGAAASFEPFVLGAR